MQADIFTRSQLLLLLEEPELGKLIESLKKVCQHFNEETALSELTLLSGRYNVYLHNRNNGLLDTRDLKVEFNQIKFALLQFIKGLSLPEGEISPTQLRKKKLRDYWLGMINYKWKWSIFSAIITFSVIGLGQIHIQTANIELRARVSQLGFKTASEWKIGQAQDLFLEEFAADLLQSTSFRPQEVKNLDLPFSMFLKGSSRLDLIHIPTNQIVTIGTDRNDLFIRIATGTVEGSVDVTNVQAKFYDQDSEINGIVGTMERSGLIDFRSDPGVIFSLKPSSPKPIDFPQTLVDSVGFRRISFDQDSSTIKSGTLQVEGKETILELGDHLVLSKFTKGRLAIVQHNGDLEIVLKAQVNQVKCKQSGTWRNLMPNWLTYLRSNQTIPFYAGLFVIVFGFLYTLRKEFLNKYV